MSNESITAISGINHITKVRVAEVKGKIIGFSGVAPVKGEHMLDHLWIEPDQIGKGIGKILFDDAVICARKMGWTKFTIAADPYAEEFYVKQGANRIGQSESKVKPGFFLPLLEFSIGIILIGENRVKDIQVQENNDTVIDFSKFFPQLYFDWDRNHVQKKSASIAMGRFTVGQKLVQAQDHLPNGYRLLVKECHRPMWVQKEFWDGYSTFLKNKYPQWSAQEIYDECSKLNPPLGVAPHATGGAVDLTLMDKNGTALEMGTSFNYTDASNISDEARINRQRLMSVMSKAGFVNYPIEWWHWSYGDKYWALQTRQPYAIFDAIDDNLNTNSFGGSQ